MINIPELLKYMEDKMKFEGFPGTVTRYCEGDGKTIVGFSIYRDGFDYMEQVRKDVRWTLGLCEQAVEFLQKQTPEGIQELNRLALIDYKKRQIEKLNKEISELTTTDDIAKSLSRNIYP